MSIHVKPTNPKDAVGIKKWRQFVSVPFRVLWEVGIAMLEGGRKYGLYNYRHAGVRASVYVDAALGHIHQWWEGEDLDPDTGLSHITKAIASLVVLRDGMLEGNFTDDRPLRHQSLDAHRDLLQEIVDDIFERIPEAKEPFTEVMFKTQRAAAASQLNPRVWRRGADLTIGDYVRAVEDAGGNPVTNGAVWKVVAVASEGSPLAVLHRWRAGCIPVTLAKHGLFEITTRDAWEKWKP